MILVEGNSRPQLVFHLRRGGSAIDLTSAVSVAFKLQKPSEAVYTETATVEDADAGKISVDLDPAELDETGWHYGEVQITWAGAALENSMRRFDIYVRPEYGEAP